MQSRHRRLATNVLVIGTGGAGLRASIELAERGVDVLAVGKRPQSVRVALTPARRLADDAP